MNKCIYYELSRKVKTEDRNHEIQSYERVGCYSCDGYRENCISYSPLEEIAENDGKGKNGNK